MTVKIHMMNESGKSIYCTGRSGMYLIRTRDTKKVTCQACLRRLYKQGKYK